MISFIGEYESTIDAKGRFLFPSGFKKQLPGEDNTTFVINRGFEKCLTLYPLQSWKPIFKELSQLNDFDPKVREFRRYFLNGATQVDLDNAGRLLLPQNLMEHASLEKDIVLVSALNKIEIWDKIKYQQFFDSFSPDSFSKLANEVMNKPNDNLFNGRQN
ncbi:MAG: division/cell wall cluster transcriptional repressor MraZ [Bacteroidetes bacterium]|nr:division/cell wall cluster transcriptional repressor MraZ [Bacteroidota bacterium]